MENLTGAPITALLITINVLVALYQNFQDPTIIDKLSFKPRRILDQKEYYRLLTSGFVHGGFLHLFFNMYALYLLGPYLERNILSNPSEVYLGERASLGWLWFLILYFGSELGAHLLTFSQRKNDYYYSSVGASGAVSGVVFAFCLYEPFQIFLLFFFIPMPAILFAVGYVWVFVLRDETGAGRATDGGDGTHCARGAPGRGYWRAHLHDFDPPAIGDDLLAAGNRVVWVKLSTFAQWITCGSIVGLCLD